MTVEKYLGRNNANSGGIKCHSKSRLSDSDKRHIFRLASNTMTSSSKINRELCLDVTDRTIRNTIESNPNLEYVKKKRRSWTSKVIAEKRLG